MLEVGRPGVEAIVELNISSQVEEYEQSGQLLELLKAACPNIPIYNENDILDAGWYTIISGNNMNLIPTLYTASFQSFTLPH